MQCCGSMCFRLWCVYTLKKLKMNIDNCHSQFFINENIKSGLRISPKEHVSVGGYYVSG